MLRRALRLAAVTFAVAAAGVVLPASPGRAATCSTTSGVTVVVDFHQLGKGLSTTCDPARGGKAADLFADAGHTLTYVDGEPFVCEVDGAPATQCARTPPANAYWSLWWSDGKSGTWTYAAAGVESLHVPEGGYVALSWQKGNAQVPPGVAARSHTATSPTSPPTSHPTHQPTSNPSSHPTQTPASSPTSTPVSPSATPSAGQSGKHHQVSPSKSSKPHHHASKTAGDQADGPLAGVSSGNGGDGGAGSGGLPGWVAPVAVVVMFAGGGTIALIRRKSRGGA